jgi:bacterioferritin-associated ferredoxin
VPVFTENDSHSVYWRQTPNAAIMIVCLCQRISDRDIRHAAESGIRDFETLQDETAIARNCGCCHDCAREVFEAACDASAARRPSMPTRVGLAAVAAA